VQERPNPSIGRGNGVEERAQKVLPKRTNAHIITHRKETQKKQREKPARAEHLKCRVVGMPRRFGFVFHHPQAAPAGMLLCRLVLLRPKPVATQAERRQERRCGSHKGEREGHAHAFQKPGEWVAESYALPLQLLLPLVGFGQHKVCLNEHENCNGSIATVRIADY